MEINNRIYTAETPSETEIKNCLCAAGIYSNLCRWELFPRGIVHTNVRVFTDDGTSVVIRINERKQKIGKEAMLLNQLAAVNGIMVPKVLFVDTSCTMLNREYMIIEYILGEDLDDFIKNNDGISDQLGLQLGITLGVLHKQIPCIKRNPVLCLKPNDSVLEHLLGVENYKYFYDRFSNDLNDESSHGLVHCDIQPSNIRVQLSAGEIKLALIDFEASGYGSKDIDLARAELSLFNEFSCLRNAFYDGYRTQGLECTIRTCAYVAVYIRMMKAAWVTRSNDACAEIKRRLMQIKEEGQYEHSKL